MSKKILLVDDDLFIRELYDEVLKNSGYDVQTAIDGKEGLELIEANTYDLVLLDIMLPQLDGMGIITKLKENKKDFDFKKIILLTNLTHDPVITEALHQGVHSCLTKAEITPDTLVKHVQTVLGGKPAVATKPAPADAKPKSSSEEIKPTSEKPTEEKTPIPVAESK